MPEATKTCPHCGAPEDQEFPFMFLCGSSTKAARRTWACQHIQSMNRGNRHSGKLSRQPDRNDGGDAMDPVKEGEFLFEPVDVEGLKTPGQQIGPMRIAIQDDWPKEPNGTWCPGDYLNKCRCGIYFCGRKHSTMCWPCAEKYDRETAHIARESEEVRVPLDWKNNTPGSLDLHPIEMSRKPPKGMKASYFWMLEGYRLAVRRSEMTVRAADQTPPPEPDRAAWLTKAEIARAVAGGYRNGVGTAVWIDPAVAHEIAERIEAKLRAA